MAGRLFLEADQFKWEVIFDRTGNIPENEFLVHFM